MTASENGQRFSLPLPLDHFFFCFLAPDAAGAILNDEFWWFGDEQERERQSWLQGLFLCATKRRGDFSGRRAASVARALGWSLRTHTLSASDCGCARQAKLRSTEP